MVTIEDRVRFSETDLMGVVHHTNYLRWFEMGRVAYFRACGIELTALRDKGYQVPIVEVHARFRQSARFDDVYQVRTVLTHVDRIKFQFSYQVLRKKDGALLVEGDSTNAFTDLNGRPKRLDVEEFEKLRQVAAKERKIQE